MTKINLKDIAQKANVSVGTVDRVIHNRGKVSPAALQKVKAAIRELNYSPNLVARSLATKKQFKIAVFIPSPTLDSFWQQPLRGIKKAEEFIKDFGFSVELFTYNDQNPNLIMEIAPKIIEGGFSSVLAAPNNKEEFNLFFDLCEQHQLPYIQINTFLDRQDDQFLSYIGQDSYGSGKLAAKLLNFTAKESDTLLILHLEKEVYNAEHLVKKEKGFKDYFKKQNKHLIQIEQQSFSEIHDKQETKKFIRQILKLYPKLSGVFVTTSKLHFVIEEFLEYGSKKIKFVGFDLIDENLKYLKSEHITFLINQNPIQQGYLATMQIFNHLIKKQSFDKIQYLPLDVVMEENLDYYLKGVSAPVMVS